jgi:superfamily I DNA and RNA helicase
MNEKEIRAKYEARKCETQMEFDRLMSEMNTEQTHLNHPFLDRERELIKQKKLLEQQKSAINIQLDAIKLERLDLEQKRKDINRVFHDLKHELIMMNPLENYAKEQ